MTIYVLSLKTWEEYDIAHHWYGRIHWKGTDPCECSDEGTVLSGDPHKWLCLKCGADCTNAGFNDADSLTEEDPSDPDSYASARHNSKESAIEGAKRWFRKNAKPEEDTLIVATWTLCGWDKEADWQHIEGRILTEAEVKEED